MIRLCFQLKIQLWFFISVSSFLYGYTFADNNVRPNFIILFMDDLGYGDMGFTGHPTTSTPNLDRLAWNGKILTTWYSGCSICTGSRTALMTGRQFPRTGIPGVLSSTASIGLPLNETTIAEQLKKSGYATAAIGKWHLGQRRVYLPGNRGFDYYLGIPYSDDMGNAIASVCPGEEQHSDANGDKGFKRETVYQDENIEVNDENYPYDSLGSYPFSPKASKYFDPVDPAGQHLPLVYQELNHTEILEQPLDFTTLADKYNRFAMEFLEKQQQSSKPFFLYFPFSHVHTTSRTQPERQYAGCNFKNKTKRGAFGDALAEADWIVGNVMRKLKELQLEENTMILFTSDNGPWMIQKLSGGSEGLFTGRYAGYSNTGKGSTWEGGIRMPAFAHWKGRITPFSRSSEIISSLDVFPTLSALAGLELPKNRTYDGRDMSDILLTENGKSKHDFLFFYSRCNGGPYWSISSVRHGKYKAHWCTASGTWDNATTYDPPLLFDVEKDPSESLPISVNEIPTTNDEDKEAMMRIMKAYATEKATFEFGNAIPFPDGDGEGPGRYGICCDRTKECNCPTGSTTDNFIPSDENKNIGILNLGIKRHHDKYHELLGEAEPSPPRTQAQRMLNVE